MSSEITAFGLISSMIGFSMYFRKNGRSFSGIVAEKTKNCSFSGNRLAIWSTSFKKPISNVISASSTTNANAV